MIKENREIKRRKSNRGGASRLIAFRIKLTDFALYQNICNENNSALSTIPLKAIINLIDNKKK